MLHAKHRLSPKTLAIVCTVLGTMAIIVIRAVPAIAVHLTTSHLRTTYTEQAKILSPTISALVGDAPERTVFQCGDSRHEYMRTRAVCENFQIYHYDSTPLPAADRQTVIQTAAKLDALLQQNGWVVDRPQDKIQTVVGSIPTEPLEAFHGISVPFHKNIGSISCNLEIDFSGPTDGTSPGVINVNRFSCSQHISYFAPHMHQREFTSI